MNIKKIISAVLISFVTVSVGFTFESDASAHTDKNEFPCQYSAEAPDGTDVEYGASSIEKLSFSDAVAKNILEGYSDDLLEVLSDDYSLGKGVVLDFSSLMIPTEKISSIVFRIYIAPDGVTDNYPRIRINSITDDSTSEKAVDYYAGDVEGHWFNFIIDAQGTNFVNGYGFEHLSENGYLGRFELAIRSQTDIAFYIDEISYTLKEEFSCEYSPVAYNYPVTRFGSTSVTKLSQAEATALEIPDGYTENILSVTNSDPINGTGIWLDFSALKIPTEIIRTLTFRVYIGNSDELSGGLPAIAIVRPDGTNNWVLMKYLGSDGSAGQWIDVTLDSENGGDFFGNHNFEHLSQDGYLGAFELGAYTNSSSVPFYIDSITYTLVPDTEAPIISYEGASTVYWTENAKFEPNVSATDAIQGDKINIEYIWSDPNAVNSDSTLNKGEYDLTVRASDFAGNVSSLRLRIVVGDAETEPPVILTYADEMRLTAGTIPLLTPKAQDNSGVVTVSGEWSDGALDSRGALTEGTHSYTITAYDPSMNCATKVILVYVTAEENHELPVIDENSPDAYNPFDSSDAQDSDAIEETADASETKDSDTTELNDPNDAGCFSSICGTVLFSSVILTAFTMSKIKKKEQ